MLLDEGLVALDMLEKAKARHVSGITSQYQVDPYKVERAQPENQSNLANHVFPLPEKMVHALTVEQIDLTSIMDLKVRKDFRDEAKDILSAVPEFDGNIVGYWPWLDAAADYIGQAYGSERSKVISLANTLTGQAKGIYNSVGYLGLVSLKNFVWSLHVEFGNKGIIRSRALRDLEILKKPEEFNSSSCREFVMDARRAVHILEKIEALADFKGQVYQNIYSKLPSSMAMRWMRRGVRNDIHGILDFVEDEGTVWCSHAASRQNNQ
jgi:hypothetical protein